MILLFYAITPALLQVRTGTIGYGLLCGAIAVLLAIGPNWLASMSPRLAMYFPAYALRLWLARGNRPEALRCLASGLSFAALWLILTFQIPAPMLENSPICAIWAGGVALSLFGAAQLAETGMLPWRWPEPIAYASYFLYLFHRVIYAITLKVVAHACDVSRLTVLILISLPISIITAWSLQKMYDRIWENVKLHRNKEF